MAGCCGGNHDGMNHNNMSHDKMHGDGRKNSAIWYIIAAVAAAIVIYLIAK